MRICDTQGYTRFFRPTPKIRLKRNAIGGSPTDEIPPINPTPAPTRPRGRFIM